jgi:hypothetical protein
MPAREPTLSRSATIVLALVLGLFLAWAAVWLIPWVEHLGARHKAAMKLPFIGFGVGVCVAFGVRRSSDARGFLTLFFAPLICGVIGWLFFGLPAGALLMFLGASEDAADLTPIIGFVLGVGLGLWGWSYYLVWAIRQRAKEKTPH